MTPDQRREVDAILEGPAVTTRSKRALVLASAGGDVKKAKRA